MQKETELVRNKGRFQKGYTPHNKGKQMPSAWRPIIAILPDGKWKEYRHAGEAATEYGVGRPSICQCCILNKLRKEGAGGKINTDHRIKGVRYYYSNDMIWLDKRKLRF